MPSIPTASCHTRIKSPMPSRKVVLTESYGVRNVCVSQRESCEPSVGVVHVHKGQKTINGLS
eukprot:2835417-Amphidinium_carterae.2